MSQPSANVPFESPAVFNFFPPSYVIPGTTLNAPEFGLENTASVTDRLTLANHLVFNSVTGFNVDLSATSPLGQILAHRRDPGAGASTEQPLPLWNDGLSNTAAAITNEIKLDLTTRRNKYGSRVYLVITSSQYKILH